MNNKKKIILLIAFYIIGFVIQIIGLTQFKDVNFDISLIVSFSSAIPISACILIASSMIPEKYKALKYICWFYAAMILIAFVVLCLLSVFCDFTILPNGGVTIKS